MKRNGWVYDYETLINVFVAVFINLKDPKEKKVFVISPWQNDYDALCDFLNECIQYQHSMISYNGLKFDNQISRYIINHSEIFGKKTIGPYSEIYKFAQKTIEAGNFKSGISYTYPTWDPVFRERDVLAINNYDNAAKRTSLKWLQFMMNWPNLMDMPMPHDIPIIESQVPDVIKYCINDVMSTRKKFLLDKEEVLLRDFLTEKFKTNMLNQSEPKIAKTIFGQALAKEMGISLKELSKMQTVRKFVNLDEVILDYIKFKDPKLKQTLSTFKKLKLDAENLKGSFNAKVMYKGVEISYALGGIHGAKTGIHQSDKNYVIKSFDVISYYPNLAIKNGWHPAHLPKGIFIETYENNFYERRKYPKGHPLNYVYKIVLNSAYGLSNEKHGSFLKDSQFTMAITVNGQLLLTMLMEDLVENIPGSRPLMYNTDGGEIMIPREYEQTFYNVCKKWEELTKLELEYDTYEKLIISDVNSYIGVYKGKEITKEEAYDLLRKAKEKNFVQPVIKKTKDGRYLHYKTKEKGRFEVEKPLHKNKSYPIVRKMLYNYFALGIDPEITLDKSTDIFDFCAAVRAKGKDKLFAVSINPDTGCEVKKQLQKTNRYFMSNTGVKLIKHTEKTKSRIEAFAAYEQLLNVYDKRIPFESYNINKSYYLNRVSSELKKFNQLQIKQKNLFS